MTTLNYQGLDVKTSCRYIYFHIGDTFSFRENTQTSVYEVIFPKGSTSDNVSGILGIPRVGENQVLQGMSRPEKFNPVTVTLNGLKFRKTTYDQHTLKIVIVMDSSSRVIQSYQGTTLVISEKDYRNPEFIEFLLYSGGLHYLIPETPKKCSKGWEIRNFPRIIIGKKSLDLKSDSDVIYSLREKYDKYRIRSIDYQNQFVEEMRRILTNYGVEFVRFNKEKTLVNTSYVSYRFSQTPVNNNHPMYSDQQCQLTNHRLPVELELHTPNTQLFFDFKNRYQNVDLLTNFCEMTTMDKYGDLWTSAIKWGRLSEDFSQTYESDNNSNFSLSAQFTCELFFYEAYDIKLNFLEEINIEIAKEEEKAKTNIKT